MYNAPPHPSVFSWSQAYWCGGVACYAYCKTPEELQFLEDSYNLVSVQLFLDPEPLNCGLCKIETPEFTYIGVEGTSRDVQWLSYLSRIGLVTREGWHGNYIDFFSTLADAARERLGNAVGSKRLVLCGHSLGGAVASILAELLRREGAKVEALWTYGSPKPGTSGFADNYTIPAYRLVGQNDIVPSLPPTYHYYSYPLVVGASSMTYMGERTLSHVGEIIEVGDLDLSEVASTAIETAEASWYRAAEGIAGHYMGSYQEAIWVRLSAEQRGVMTALFDSLTRLGQQGTPNFPLDVATPAEEPGLLNTASASERDLVDQLTGDDGMVTLHLFEAPATVPSGATVESFTECSFPGYSPQRIPASDIIDLGKAGGTKTTPATVTFRAQSPVPTPAEARGVYAVLNDGGPKLLTAYMLPAVKVFGGDNDSLDVRAELQVTRVY